MTILTPTNSLPTQLQLKARAKRARRAPEQINTNASRRQRLFLFQRNLSSSDSSLKCVHVRIVYTLTRQTSAGVVERTGKTGPPHNVRVTLLTDVRGRS